jgi:hypothetical protein
MTMRNASGGPVQSKRDWEEWELQKAVNNLGRRYARLDAYIPALERELAKMPPEDTSGVEEKKLKIEMDELRRRYAHLDAYSVILQRELDSRA